jgi:bla regulator protein blaR1
VPRLRTRLTPSVFLAVCIAGVTVTSRAQDQALSSPSPASVAEPKFEVTSVKKSGPNRQGGPFRFGLQPGGRFTVSGMPVSALLTMAYGIQRFQLIGGPSWINSDRFDINAVAEDVPVQPTPPGPPNRMQLLLRSLLKERFALVVHNETRELPVSYLVVAREDRKLGERLRPSTVDCRALFAARAKEGPSPPAPPKPGEVPQCGMRGGLGRIAAGSMPMSNLASLLANLLSRPVYDRTNLTGNFDIQLDYTPDQMPQIPPGVTLPPGLTLPSPDGPSLNTALEEQLGLKLDATRGPVDVLVIDSVAQPEPD